MYSRMIVSMFITLFTSRIVLQQLGETDFGVYNVVAGLIVVFSFVSGSFASASSRFISYAIGEDRLDNIKSIFSALMFINIGLVVVVIILAETIGLWYVINMLNYPIGLSNTVMIIYQISIITTVFGILAIPFTSMIIGQERMDIYAYLSIFDVVAKLAVAISLICLKNKLIYYAGMQCIITLILLAIYFFYCNRNGFLPHISLKPDFSKIKEILSFSSWTLYSGVCNIASTQGINLLLNFSYGVILNTAYGLTMQVQNAIRSFSLGFQVALNPQLIKTYSSGDMNGHRSLIFRSVRFSFFLVLIVACPIYFNVAKLLNLWLGQYPEQTVSFIKWTVLATIVTTIANPFGVSVEASGKIGKMTFIAYTITLLSLPFSWILLKFVNNPSTPFIALFVAQVMSLFVRLFYAQRVASFQISSLIRGAILPCFLVGITTFGSCIIICHYITGNSITMLLIRLSIGIVIPAVLSYYLGMKKHEQQLLKDLIVKKMHLK